MEFNQNIRRLKKGRKYSLMVFLFLFISVLLSSLGCLGRKEGANEPISEESGFLEIKNESETKSMDQQPVVAPKEYETVPAKTIVSETQSVDLVPIIAFEKVVHDFGEIGPGSTQTCEFNFKNAGNTTLEITDVSKTCGCTPFVLEKKKYAPGETGSLKVSYHAGTHPGSTSKSLTVSSNDPNNQKVILLVKGKIVPKVAWDPSELNLVLKEENAGCPDITLTSRDGIPFAVTDFQVTGNCLTAEFDPSVKATKFILKPKADIEKLQKYLRGYVRINITHPWYNTVNIAFNVLPEFTIRPAQILVFNAVQNEPLTREIWVLNNYGDDFIVESTSTDDGIIKVLSQEKMHNSYKFQVEITPPAETKQSIFSDVFRINLQGGKKLSVTCRGFYSKK